MIFNAALQLECFYEFAEPEASGKYLLVSTEWHNENGLLQSHPTVLLQIPFVPLAPISSLSCLL